jgi:hypothetical protein
MSIIQRFRLDALRKKAGRLYLQGQPFTGIAYEVRGDRVVANYQVTDGVRGGPAEAWDPARVRALFGELITVDADDTDAQFPTEGVYFDGAFFYGVAYDFYPDTGRLLLEQDFRPEAPAPMREWYPSGALEADFGRMRPDGTGESVSYFEDGEIHTVAMSDMGWGITVEGRLRTLLLYPGYPENDLQRVPFRVDSILYLVGPAITDEILERLEDLPRLEDFELENSSVSANGLERFRVCTNLKKLVTRKNAGFGEADVRNLIAHLPPACEWKHRLD